MKIINALILWALAFTAAAQNGASGGLPAKLRLDEFSHALDVQLTDKLGASKLFKVLEDRDVKDALRLAAGGADAGVVRRKLAIAAVNSVPTLASRYGLPAPAGPAYDLKNAAVLEQFKNSGINFLLLTTVEDMDENHLDGATVTRDFEYVNGRQTGWWVQDTTANIDDNNLSVQRSGARQINSSWQRETVQVSPLMQKEQSLRVTLRCRLLDAKTGELLGSRNKTYARGRSYSASAQGNNELSMGDLYQTAAEDLADWARLIVEDDAFPIKVLKVEDDEVLINRGSESGILQNSYYAAWFLGEEVKDPDTGELLGREERKVGKVLVTQLQTKFSRAKIVEDKGIKPGVTLRRIRN